VKRKIEGIELAKTGKREAGNKDWAHKGKVGLSPRLKNKKKCSNRPQPEKKKRRGKDKMLGHVLRSLSGRKLDKGGARAKWSTRKKNEDEK